MKKIGVIGVDAGLCWIGDPCYVIHTDEPAKHIGRDWHEFCDAVLEGRTHQFNYDLGHPGLGVCVSTGYGDGTYPVYAKFTDEGHVAEVRIVFIRER